MTNASNKSDFQHTKTIPEKKYQVSEMIILKKKWHCVNDIQSYQITIYLTDKDAVTQQNAYVPCLNEVSGVKSKLSFQHKGWFPDHKISIIKTK